MKKEKVLSNSEKLFIEMAIDQYKNLYLPEAEKLGITVMEEREYVALALENFDKFEANLKICELKGHDTQTISLNGNPFRGCTRCGLSPHMSKLIK